MWGDKITKNEEYLRAAILSILPVFLTIISGIAIDFMIGDLRYNTVGSLITIWASMIIGMVVFPLGFLKKKGCVVESEEIGLKISIPKDVIIICAVFASLYAYKVRVQGERLLYAVLLNTPISFCEEFWCKSIMFLQLKRISRNRSIIIIVSASIFAFITHMSEGLWENLILRLPFGIITGIVYARTNKLLYPVALHFIYNAIGS